MRRNPQLYEEECRRVQSRFDEAVRLAEEAFVGELAKLVSHLTERLSGTEDGKPKLLRDSVVENLTEFFQRFRDLNVRSSEQLGRLVADAQRFIRGVEPQALRDNAGLRQHVATEMSRVQSVLDGLLVDRPRRNILRRIQRECRDRLLDGKYVASGGAITGAHELKIVVPVLRSLDERTWEEFAEHYRTQHKRRVRRKANEDSDSRLDIARRIFEPRRKKQGLPPGVTLRECMTLEALEYLQDQLLDGAESNYDRRSPNTVNSMLAAIMAFVRYAYDHEWIDRVPPLRKLNVDEVMRGRPITGEEFERMLEAVPKAVGDGPAEEWRFALKILWESGFRIADLLDFSWDDIERIHPVWPHRKGQHPTLVIPSTQKNGKNEEIPLLPGLKKLLDAVPQDRRVGFVVNPSPAEYEFNTQAKKWFMPKVGDLADLIGSYSNCAIARACGVSDVTVQNWLDRHGLKRVGKIACYGSEVPADTVNQLRSRAARKRHQNRAASGRLTRERVSRVIAQIGEEAKVVVRQPDKETGRRIKYASAHDLRRSCAERLINAGVSAETLMVIMRHKDFATTRKFYGAKRAAQAAATEIHQKLVIGEKAEELVRDVEQLGQLTAGEMKTLKRLLMSLRQPVKEGEASC